MKVYRNIADFKDVPNAVVTTGMFDGVHLGHQKIISRLSEIARNKNGETVLLTFYPHPRVVLFPEDNGLEMLNTQDEKILLLEKYGIDHLIIYPFTKDFSRLSSIEFVRNILVNKLNTKWLVIGYNHHFGRNREGSFEHLKEFGPTYGFEVEEIPAKDIDSIEISSTKIRNAIKSGDIITANAYLGHNFTLSGKVISGQQLGRTLNYPTANISINDNTKIIPADGIYAVYVVYNNKKHGGMLSIGNNPTIKNKGRSIEVHIFDFSENIYEEEITILFVEKLREEIKFKTLDELKNQLQQDELNSKAKLSL